MVAAHIKEGKIVGRWKFKASCKLVKQDEKPLYLTLHMLSGRLRIDNMLIYRT